MEGIPVGMCGGALPFLGFIMTLDDMASHVVELIGSPDSASKTQAKEFLKRRYRMIYDSHLWEDSKVSLTLTTYDNQVILPAWVDKVLQVVLTRGELTRTLGAFDRQNIYQVDPKLLSETGEVVGFSHLNTVATHMNPPSVRVKLVSSSGTDTASVRIQGIHNGNEISETVSLSGTTPVSSQYYYDEVYTLSKPQTTGYVRATTANDDANELQVLLPEDNERRHQRIQLHRDITEGHKLSILAKRTCAPLQHDSDTPQLGMCVNALLSFATADMLTRMRQISKAQVHIQEANAQVASMMDQDKQQRANVVRFIPEE